MDILNFNAIAPEGVFLRVFLACGIGFLLGYDRKKRDKPIGYQSYVIITLITCLLAMMAQELYTEYATADGVIKLDLAKIIAGTLTGIGFLGAGAIIKRDEDHVIGTATGASIWAAGGLGLILGFGYYSLALIGAALIWLTLSILPRLMK